MNIVFLVVQQTMFFSIPLLIVALGGMFTERGGVTNIALDGMMIMGAFTSIFFINQMQGSMSGQTLLILAILIAVGTGMVFSLLLAYSAINMKSDQIIGGTALNMFAPAFAIYVAEPYRIMEYSRLPSPIPSGFPPFRYWVTFPFWEVCSLKIPTLPRILDSLYWFWQSSYCIKPNLVFACEPVGNIPKPLIRWESMFTECVMPA